ncbi:MAG: transcription elongation factor GreB [Kofleriaceae bacterium]
MSTRYRPPAPPRSAYITAGGARRLREELDHLWKVERPRVTQAVSDAAALGDRSENADYIYGKRRLREIDRRVRFLVKRLDAVTVVTEAPKDPSRAFFGAWVTLEDEDGATVEYQIVGPDESDARTRRISMDAPVARALLGRAVGDEVSVRRPAGEATFTVTGVRYEVASAVLAPTIGHGIRLQDLDDAADDDDDGDEAPADDATPDAGATPTPTPRAAPRRPPSAARRGRR